MHPICHVTVFLWFLGSFCTCGIYKLHHAEPSHVNWICLVVPQARTIHWVPILVQLCPCFLCCLFYITSQPHSVFLPPSSWSFIIYLKSHKIMRLLDAENLHSQKWVLSPSESSLWGTMYFVISGLPSSHAFLPTGPHSWPIWFSFLPPSPSLLWNWVWSYGFSPPQQSQHLWKFYVWLFF